MQKGCLLSRQPFCFALRQSFHPTQSATTTIVNRATAIATVITEHSKNSYNKNDPPKAILVYKIKATAFHISFPPDSIVTITYYDFKTIGVTHIYYKFS